MSDTLFTIQKIITRRMGVEPGEVQPSATWETLMLNPSTVADIIHLDINPLFRVNIGMGELASFGTIGDMVAWIDKNAP